MTSSELLGLTHSPFSQAGFGALFDTVALRARAVKHSSCTGRRAMRLFDISLFF